ncbi:MAG: hypothetical protein FJ109_00870 [Deltaproteobacteria bacterium]|nr:hypothetical protein [Deltaproteobacteria bacterium]
MARAREKTKASAARKGTSADVPSPTAIRGERSFFEKMETGVWGLLIVSLGLLMELALLTYRVGDGVGGALPDNLVGPVGHWLAHILFSAVGYAAHALGLSALALGVLLIGQRTLSLQRFQVVGLSILLLPAAVLLQIVLPAGSSLPRGGGGLVGQGLDSLLEALLHRTGAIVLAVACILAGLSILLRIHVRTWFLVPWRFVCGLFRGRSLSRPDETGSEDPTVPMRRNGGGAGEADRLEDANGPGGSARVVRTGSGREDATRLAVARDRPSGDAAERGAADLESTRKGRPEPATAPPTKEATRAGQPPGPAESPVPDPPTAESTRAARRGAAGPAVVRPDPSVEVPEEDDEVEEGEELKEGHVPAARIHRREPERHYELPDINLLDLHPPSGHTVDDDTLRDSAGILEQKLKDFKVEGAVGDIHPGPVIALYEFRPGRGIKVSTVANLSKDLAMALAAEQVRVIAPIPGRDVVGIEIPNKVREVVYLRDLLADQRFKEGKHKLPLVLGKDISGKPTFTDLTKMPHLLVAGTTGSGKSVALHAFILSVIYRLTPNQVKLLLVDTKMLELTAYAEIPHLLLPVVTEARDAAVALRWAVGEMERRNRLMSSAGVPNISEYNQLAQRMRESPERRGSINKITRGPCGERIEENVGPPREEPEEMPYIVVVIDELADLMMVAGKHVETSVARLAQMARAAGIHMIIATQNPTIKVVTGIIKANMPSRISFKVRTMQDSRVILDQNGADDLLGWGDMLFLGPGSSKLQRIHGAFVSTEERMRVVDYLRSQGTPEYDYAIMESAAAGADEELGEESGISGGSGDDLYEQAVAIAVSRGKISTSALQRELGVGYNKAALLMSRMEKDGLVGPQEAAGKPRVVLRSR